MPAAIPAQSVPHPNAGHSAGTIGSLGLKPAQVVEARVLGAGADGTTRIAIGNQILDAALPGRLPPGTTLQLAVSGSGATAQLVVLQAAAPVQLPDATTTLQALSLRAGQVIEAKVLGHTPDGATRLAFGSRVVDVALPQAHPPGTVLQLRPHGEGATQRLVVTQATPPAAPHAQPTATLQGLGLRPGQVVQAQVLGPGQSIAAKPVLPSLPTVAGPNSAGTTGSTVSSGPAPGVANAAAPAAGSGSTVRLAIGNQVIDTVLPGRYQPGTTLQLQAQGSGANTRLVVLQSVGPGAGLASPGAPVRAAQPPQLAVVATPFSPAQQTIALTAQAAVGKQDSIATLFASLAGLGGKLGNLPASVQQPALAALAARLNLNSQPLNGQTLKQAVLRSGIFFESLAAKGGAASRPGNGSGIFQGDLKAILLTLKGSLENWLGSDTSPATHAGQRPAPPTRGALPHAQRPGAQMLPDAISPTQTGKALLTQTEAALARMRLAQIASLPDSSGLQRTGGSSALAEWNLEIPLILGSELSVAQFQISRDGKPRSRRETRGWQVRFSVDFGDTGPVNAQVTLRAGIVGVNLWAEREETAVMLKDQLDVLGEALEAIGLKPGRLYCRHGAPAEPNRPVGTFMDRCS
ncbi:MAG: flagellar hook-length control protein FliK [Hyphomicrobiales bacterium]|nr:flagellar hook-length control protein FliK [Hyphomicrobiales bacterium]